MKPFSWVKVSRYTSRLLKVPSKLYYLVIFDPADKEWEEKIYQVHSSKIRVILLIDGRLTGLGDGFH